MGPFVFPERIKTPISPLQKGGLLSSHKKQENFSNPNSRVKNKAQDDDSSHVNQRPTMCSPHRLPCLWLTWMLPIQTQPGVPQVPPPPHPGAAHTHLRTPQAQARSSSNSPSHIQLFQRTVLGGTELFLFGSLGFADGLPQTHSESSAPTHRVFP